MALDDFSVSLGALNALHDRLVHREGLAIAGEAARLRVSAVRQGSIIIELAALSQTLQLLQGTNTAIAFAKNLRAMIEFFWNRKAETPKGLQTKDAADVGRLMQPAINDAHGALNIVARENSVVHVNLQINTLDAVNIKNRATNWAARQLQPVQGRMAGQLFSFFQARDAANPKTGDLGVIEAITDRPVKTYFANEDVKRRLLSEALFQKYYIVDVDVQTVEGVPRLYTILDVKGELARD